MKNKILIVLSIISLFTANYLAQETSDEPSITVGFCDDEQTYAVSSFSLYFPDQAEAPLPDKKAKYKGGAKKIENFLNDNLDFGDFNELQIIAVYVGFDINCEGEAGNYRFNICDQCSNKEFFEEQLITLFNQLPENWTAAKKDGNSVDCRQLISFSINIGLKDSKSNGVANLSY